MTVGGNIWSDGGLGVNADSNNRFILNSKKDQSIYMTGGNFNELEVIDPEKRNIVWSGELNINALASDINIKSDDLDILKLDLKGHSMDICGDVIITQMMGIIDLDGGVLTIDGDLIQSTGNIKVNNGTLNVNGNYSIEDSTLNNVGKPVYNSCSAQLHMDNEYDKVSVTGDLTTHNIEYREYVTMEYGTLSVGGDIWSDGGITFSGEHGHKTVLNGDKPQKIKVNNNFNILVLKKSIDNYTFDPDPCWNELIEEVPTVTTPAVTTAITTESFETTNSLTSITTVTETSVTTTVIPVTSVSIPETTVTTMVTTATILTTTFIPVTTASEETTAVPETTTTTTFITITTLPETTTVLPETTTAVTTETLPETTAVLPETTTAVAATTLPETTASVPRTTVTEAAGETVSTVMVNAEIKAEELANIKDGGKLPVNADECLFVFDPNAVANIKQNADGKDMVLSYDIVEKDKITDEKILSIAENFDSILSIELKTPDGKKVEFSSDSSVGKVTVMIPYAAPADTDKVEIYYVLPDGTTERIKNAVYESSDNTITFTASELSYFAVKLIAAPEVTAPVTTTAVTGSTGTTETTIEPITTSIVPETTSAPGTTTTADTGTTAVTAGNRPLKGDISGNGEIDLYDAIEIAKFLVKSRDFTDEEKKIADFNGDGKVDLYDAIEIAKYLVKKLH